MNTMPGTPIKRAAIAIVDTYDTHVMMDKDWGHEQWIVNNEYYCGKLLFMNEGWQSSIHFHPVKTETMFVLDGVGMVELWERGLEQEPTVLKLDPEYDTTVTIPAGLAHRFSTPYGEDMVLVEFSMPHSEADVVRIETSSKLPEVPGD